MDNKIVERIQKLLALANSDNENEAKQATNKANELLLKYNLSLQQVENHESEYQRTDIAEVGLVLKPYQKEIAQILMRYFFVRVIIRREFVGESSGRYAYTNRPRTQYNKIIQLLGTKENCQIASYIFSYLNAAYPKLWEEYYSRDAELTQRDKVSYYSGLTQGIMEMLKETKWKVENETGLVLKEDPGLVKFIKNITTSTYGTNSKSEINPDVLRDGIEHGRNITLRKPMESGSANQSGKYIKGK